MKTKYAEIDLSVRFVLQDMDDVPFEAVRTALEHDLQDWQDGRHSFHVEQLQAAIVPLIKNAIHRAVSQQEYAEHGNKMVRTTPTSETAQAALNTDKRIENLVVRIYGDMTCLAREISEPEGD